MATNKQYLGDGVYVEHDGYQLWLTTEGSNGANRIALEPDVYSALVSYVERLTRQRALEPASPEEQGL